MKNIIGAEELNKYFGERIPLRRGGIMITKESNHLYCKLNDNISYYNDEFFDENILMYTLHGKNGSQNLNDSYNKHMKKGRQFQLIKARNTKPKQSYKLYGKFEIVSEPMENIWKG